MKATVRLVLQPTDNGVKPHMTLTLGEDVYVVFDGRLPPDCQAGCTQEHIAELDLPTIKPA